MTTRHPRRTGPATKVWVTVVTVAIAGLSWGACDQDRRPLAPEGPPSDQPEFDHVPSSSTPIRMTGGGRIDFPPGTAERNTPRSSTFQTFSLTVGDKDGDGVPEGNFRFIDHTPANRVNNQPLKLKVVSWTSLVRLAEGCTDGGIEATGVLVIENTGAQHQFRLLACDNGEPGRGRDVLELEVATAPVREWMGVLTGGNLQAHVEKTTVTPTTGDLEVRTETSGNGIPSSFTVVADGTMSQSIGPNATVRFNDLAPGEHEVRLDVPSNCAVTTPPPNPRTVTVTAGMVTSTTFVVTCEAVATTGDLRIIASTTGEGIPADYGVTVTRPEFPTLTGRVGANDSATVNVAAGDYAIELTDVPTNCTVTTPPPNPRTETVTTGALTRTTFVVSCEVVATRGDLRIIASTTGNGIPADYGLSITGPEFPAGTTARLGANDSVTVNVATGDYTIELTDVPTNCTVTPPNPRTETVTTGALTRTIFNVTCTLTPPPGGVRIAGLGTIGPGSATVGSNRQEFDFDVSSDLTGRLFYRDWSEVRPNGTVATLTVDPADPATGIVRFRDGSDVCADFTRGAEFDATARLEDDGSLVGITIAACDNGLAESGLDFFRIEARAAAYVREGFLTSGDIVKAGGGTPRATGVRVTGLGQLGTGLPLPGMDRQTFQFDVTSELAGSKFYTDFGIIRQDGSVGTLRVDPTDPGTRITAFRDGSVACADAARGVEFEGIGRVNSQGDTNPDAHELSAFTVRTCDNAMAGTGADFYHLRLFFQDFTTRYEKSGVLTAGDILKSRM